MIIYSTPKTIKKKESFVVIYWYKCIRKDESLNLFKTFNLNSENIRSSIFTTKYKSFTLSNIAYIYWVKIEIIY